MKAKTNKYLGFLLRFFIYFCVFYILFHASINETIYPFAFGIMYALIWANQKVWLVVPAYIVAGVVYRPTLEFSICMLVCSFCIIVPYFIHVLCKKVMKKWEFAIFGVAGQTATFVFQLIGGLHPILAIVSVLVGVIFMYACICVFEALIVRGFTNKLTSLEIISLFSIIAVLSDGLSTLNIGKFSFLKLFVCFVVLMFSFCATSSLSLLVASVCGLGALIATNNPIFFAPFLIWELSALIFKNRLRIFMTISVFCVEIVIGLYFKLYTSYGYIEILPVLLACVIFMCLPKRWCSEVAVIFNLSKDRMAMKNVVNRNRELLHKRLGNLGEIFSDMNNIYRTMLKKGLSFEETKSLLKQEINSKICSFCPERGHCHRTFAESTDKVFDELITVAFEKGKVTLLSVPSYLTSRCKQTNAILGSINALTEQYKKYMNMVKDVDTSKLIIADQLLGVSKIMNNLAQEVETSVSFDTERENKILDELTYFNIICIDAVVFQKDIWTMEVSLVVKSEDAEKPRIVDVVSKICGHKMCVYEVFSSSRPGYMVVNLQTAPKYDCIFGVSQRTKNGSKVSGDTYTIVKLSGNKVLFAINDGMGSGERAERMSEMSINLIENFYRAGFDNELILSTVNKLLSLHKEEIFSALDICVFDEKDGLVDFVKMASPCAFILNENECKKVESGALPMGIVENINPLVKKNMVQSKDFVILMSDGISDSFQTTEQLMDIIKDIKTKKPQEFADELLERAVAQNNGYAVDDMTVLAIKILDF